MNIVLRCARAHGKLNKICFMRRAFPKKEEPAKSCEVRTACSRSRTYDLDEIWTRLGGYCEESLPSCGTIPGPHPCFDRLREHILRRQLFAFQLPNHLR